MVDPHYRPPRDTTGISVAAALDRYPDAQSATAACNAARLDKELDGKWRGGLLTRLFALGLGIKFKIEIAPEGRVRDAEAALQTLPSDQPLANSMRAEIALSQPYTLQGLDVQRKIMRDFEREDLGLASWAEEKQAKFLEALNQNPAIEAARQNWEQLSTTQKIDLARQVHAIQMDAYGAKPVPIEELYKEKDEEKKQLEYGAYLQKKRKIFLNLDPNAIKEFDSFIETISHEGSHAIIHQLRDRDAGIKTIEQKILEQMGEHSGSSLSPDTQRAYNEQRTSTIKRTFPNDPGGWNTDLGPSGRLSGVMPMLHYNDGIGYISARLPNATIKHYKANPVEELARSVENSTSTFMMKTPEEKRQEIERLKWSSGFSNELHLERMERREQDRRSGVMCPPTTSAATPAP